MNAGADTYGNEPVAETAGSAGRIVWSLIAAAVYFAVIRYAFRDEAVGSNAPLTTTTLYWIGVLATIVACLAASVTMVAKGNVAFSTVVCVFTWWTMFRGLPTARDPNMSGHIDPDVAAFGAYVLGFISLMFLWGAHGVKRFWRAALSDEPRQSQLTDALIMFGLVFGVGWILTQSWAAGLIIGIIAAVALFWSSKRLGRFPVRLAKRNKMLS